MWPSLPSLSGSPDPDSVSSVGCVVVSGGGGAGCRGVVMMASCRQFALSP